MGISAEVTSLSDITQIIARIESGDQLASDELLPLVYQQLRKLAEAKLSQEKPGQTLQATALVHEAYLRLVDRADPQQWENSRHFFTAAAESMRRILIEKFRQRERLKYGGGRDRVEIEFVEPAVLPLACDDILALEEALQKLEQQHPRKAELVKLRFFAGLTVPQAASALEVSNSTAENDWAYARSWLRLEMSGQDQK